MPLGNGIMQVKLKEVLGCGTHFNGRIAWKVNRSRYVHLELSLSKMHERDTLLMNILWHQTVGGPRLKQP